MTRTSKSQTLPSFEIGGTDAVTRMGYGAMRITGPGNFGPPTDKQAALNVVRGAAELGINFFDTADSYGPGVSEEILAEALAPVRDKVFIATKGGAIKSAPGKVRFDGSQAHLADAVEGSLRRLKTDRIDLYYLHRPDPNVPFEESVQALARFRNEGKIRHVGLSNVSLEQLREAIDIVPVAAVQNAYSLVRREHEGLLRFAEEQGIAFVAYAPLAAPPFDPRAPLADTNGPLAGIAKELGATPTQVALAWLFQHSPSLLTIPGTANVAHLRENVGATTLSLSGEEAERIEAAVASEGGPR